MAYLVESYAPGSLHFLPENTVQEVLQNLSILLCTPQFTVPFQRDLGIDHTLTDKTIPAAKSLLTGKIMDAVEKFEPRAKIVSIDFTETPEFPGKLNVVLEVEIDGG